MTVGGLFGGAPDFRRSRFFRYFYLPLALLYLGLTLFWGRYDLIRVQREYRSAAERSAGDFARMQAGREVMSGCRQAVGGETVPGFGDCLKASTHLVEARAAVIADELRLEKQRAVKKLVLFYLLVVVGLILLPLSLLYVFLVFFWYLLINIRR